MNVQIQPDVKAATQHLPFELVALAIFEAGEPARFGSSLYADFIADHDSSYTACCKRAGLVIMGRSSTPEFGISPSTEPRLFGPCRNPWNLTYSAGGSSGGAAAAKNDRCKTQIDKGGGVSFSPPSMSGFEEVRK